MMKKAMIYSRLVCVGVAALSMVSLPTLAAESDEFFIRPHAGVGYTSASGDGASGTSFHAGARFLLGAGGNKLYGLEVTYIDAYAFDDDKPDTEYLAVGIVLEKKVARVFNMSIGTIGYFGLGDNTNNPFGLMTNLGWEPEYKGMITPFITFRTDLIFDESTINMSSLSVGIRFRF